MPTISMFYGILVSMYLLDTQKHHFPHIHVRYAEYKASISIPSGDVLEGVLPSKQMKLVQAWIALHAEDSWPTGSLLPRAKHHTKLSHFVEEPAR